MKGISVAPGVFLDVYYDRPTRAWWACYLDFNGFQLGDAWVENSRDYALIFRPEVPVLA
jgi:hypothetical protein